MDFKFSAHRLFRFYDVIAFRSCKSMKFHCTQARTHAHQHSQRIRWTFGESMGEFGLSGCTLLFQIVSKPVTSTRNPDRFTNLCFIILSQSSFHMFHSIFYIQRLLREHWILLTIDPQWWYRYSLFWCKMTTTKTFRKKKNFFFREFELNSCTYKVIKTKNNKNKNKK